jgi:hypothetical protein
MSRTTWLGAGLLLLLGAGAASGQLRGTAFSASIDHPAIQYGTRPLGDPVAVLNQKLREGAARLRADASHGYLPSLLEALGVPVESQILAFAKTSVQSARITPAHPRALFFGDELAVGWVPGGFIELAAQDPRQGVAFYVLDARQAGNPTFVRRETTCLSCHVSYSSLDVPGMLVRSVVPDADGEAQFRFGSYVTSHDSPFEQRWGGWYVTGEAGSMRHMGNAVIGDGDDDPDRFAAEGRTLASLRGRVDTDTYLSPHSDIVALMVFDHQMHMMNLITRVGWEARYALHPSGPGRPLLAAPASSSRSASDRIRDAAAELVDYLLFVDEVPLESPVSGSSGFSGQFARRGPHDRKGRSLRELDLERRLMRYPCSYMIHTAAFDSLPAEALEAIYARMWQILSGQGSDVRYARLTLEDRRAIVEILRDTKPDLPDYFRAVDR